MGQTALTTACPCMLTPEDVLAKASRSAPDYDSRPVSETKFFDITLG